MLCTTPQEIQKEAKASLPLLSKSPSNPLYKNPSSSLHILHQPKPNQSLHLNQSMAPTNLLLCLVTFCIVMHRCHAFQFKVGGSQGWTLPSDLNASIYNHWAEHNRFQIGDSLLFVYSADHDSVLRVTKEDYASCATEKPLEKFTDGHTVYQLNQSGPHYFISGDAEKCHKNQKLIVVVLADRSYNHASNGTVAPESPPPSSSSPPSPAPSGEESPSPPPEETNPTPAPSEESSPPAKNGASSVAAGVVGTVAVFFASFLTI